MSSILKALQKLERETTHSQEPYGSHLGLRQAVPRKMAGRSRALLIRKAVLTGFAAVFLVAVSWALWRYPFSVPPNTDTKPSLESQTSDEPPLQNPSTTSPARPQRSGSDPAPSSGIGKDSEKGSATAIPQTAAAMHESSAETAPSPQKKSAEIPSAPGGVDQPLSPGAQGEGSEHLAAVSDRSAVRGLGAGHPTVMPSAAKPSRPAAPPSAIDIRADTDEAPSAAALIQPKTEKPVPAAADAASKPRSTAETSSPPAASSSGRRYQDLPVKTPQEAGLAIQALVWSSAPEERLVVVNGNILKEGGSLDGAAVTFIGEDYIVVKKDGKRWKLKFQLK